MLLIVVAYSLLFERGGEFVSEEGASCPVKSKMKNDGIMEAFHRRAVEAVLYRGTEGDGDEDDAPKE